MILGFRGGSAWESNPEYDFVSIAISDSCGVFLALVPFIVRFTWLSRYVRVERAVSRLMARPRHWPLHCYKGADHGCL